VFAKGAIFFEVIVVIFPAANGVGCFACNQHVFSCEGDTGVKQFKAANRTKPTSNVVFVKRDC
jgi:hypothetical protein